MACKITTITFDCGQMRVELDDERTLIVPHRRDTRVSGLWGLYVAAFGDFLLTLSIFFWANPFSGVGLDWWVYPTLSNAKAPPKASEPSPSGPTISVHPSHLEPSFPKLSR